MAEEDNQMRKVMPAEFPGLQDCKVRIEGETNREVNQKGPCDEPIEAEGKGETFDNLLLYNDLCRNTLIQNAKRVHLSLKFAFPSHGV